MCRKKLRKLKEEAMDRYERKTVYVLEGPDGAGKSTMALRIQKIYQAYGCDVPVVHSGPKGSLAEMYSEAVELLKTHHTVIMDRSPISEMAYGPVLRGKILGDEVDWRLWHQFFEEHDAVGVWMTADLETLTKRAFARGETFINAEQLADIKKAYDQLALDDFGWYKVYPNEVSKFLDQVVVPRAWREAGDD